MDGQLTFDVELEWSGIGKSGVGRAETANVVVEVGEVTVAPTVEASAA